MITKKLVEQIFRGKILGGDFTSKLFRSERHRKKKGKLQTHLFLEMLRTEKTHHLSYQNVIHDVKWKWMEVFFGEGGVKIGFEKIVKKL